MKSKTHFIKIEPKYFLHVINKTKKFEIRKNDRKYKIGDIVVLQEYEKEINSYTGRTAIVEITYITSFMQKRNIVVFSFELLICCLNRKNSTEQLIEKGIVERDKSIDDLYSKTPDDEKWLPDFS
jgi:ribosomal protein S17